MTIEEKQVLEVIVKYATEAVNCDEHSQVDFATFVRHVKDTLLVTNRRAITNALELDEIEERFWNKAVHVTAGFHIDGDTKNDRWVISKQDFNEYVKEIYARVKEARNEC